MPQVSGSDIKVVGKSGQISLGKSYAGKALRVEHRGEGVIVLTAVAVVPESQLWTLQEPDRSRIMRGLVWIGSTPPKQTDVDRPTRRTPKGAKRSRVHQR